MPFEKGHAKVGGRKKGSGRNQQCKLWAEKYGIAFLVRVAEGKEKDINMFGKPIQASLAKRVQAAQYLIDQGLGKAPQSHEITNPEDEDGKPIPFTFTFKT